MYVEVKNGEMNRISELVYNPELEIAMKRATETQSLSSMFRKELESYLGDLDAKVDSEGKFLIKVPNNFDSIVGAMTREDLLADEKSTGTSDHQNLVPKRTDTSCFLTIFD